MPNDPIPEEKVALANARVPHDSPRMSPQTLFVAKAGRVPQVSPVNLSASPDSVTKVQTVTAQGVTKTAVGKHDVPPAQPAQQKKH